MRTIPKSEWPSWIKERFGKQKNIEVKEKNGNFYLYKYRNVWDRKKKRPKKEVKYLGVIKRVGGRIYEHGHIMFLLWLCSLFGIDKKLKTHFPDEWKEILIFSMNRVIHPSPLKRIGSWMERTSLCKLLEINALSGKRLSKVLAKVGMNIRSQRAFMKELIKDGEILIYDGSVIFSTSAHNRLLEIGYNKDKLLLPKVNIALLFSKNRNLPIYFRIFFGSVHEIKSIEAVKKEIEGRNILFIGDKALYKNQLYAEMNERGIDFLLPLPRDDKRIRYNAKMKRVFEYRERIIKSTSYYVKPYYVYLFEDQYLKYVETSEYYKLKLSGKDVEFKERWAGKIALLSNKKFDEKEAYVLWKTRDRIEKTFNVLQNFLETDKPYVSREDVFRGYIFSSFLSLIIYYLVLNFLKKHKINDKISVEDVLFEFSKVMVEEEKIPYLSEIPAKVERLAKKLNVYNIITKIWES